MELTLNIKITSETPLEDILNYRKTLQNIDHTLEEIQHSKILKRRDIRLEAENDEYNFGHNVDHRRQISEDEM